MGERPQEVTSPEQAVDTAVRRLTTARIALGRSGSSVCTQDHLAFQLDHALARDAVHTTLSAASLEERLQQRGFSTLLLQSAVGISARTADRRTYLQRPDLGRRLSPESSDTVRSAAAALTPQPEVVFVIADGLSAVAIERNAVPLLDVLQPLLAANAWHLGPVCLVRSGRVAVGDDVGELLGAALVVVLIGERPGLSAADSLGVYLTWKPHVGRTDAERNCISNIRQGGLSHSQAAERLLSQMNRARALECSGVALGGGAGMASSLP